jgi:hypothetical protein
VCFCGELARVKNVQKKVTKKLQKNGHSRILRRAVD